jgi:uncharacterized membrane protein
MALFVPVPSKACQRRATAWHVALAPSDWQRLRGRATMAARGNIIERPDMTATGPDTTPQPILPSTDIALIIYILYFLGYFTGITAIIGVIMAHIQLETADPMLATHYRFQIVTFWIGLLYLVVGTVLLLILIGWFVLVWWFIWSLIRSIKGVLALNERRPIADPNSWMFG